MDFAQRRGLAAEHVVDEDRLVEVVVGETIGARIELGVRPGNLQPERIEPRLQMAAHPVGADQHQRAQRGDGGGADLLAGQRGAARHVRRDAAWVTAGRTSSSNSGWRGAQEAPVASSSTARASSFSAPNSSAKVGSTEAGIGRPARILFAQERRVRATERRCQDVNASHPSGFLVSSGDRRVHGRAHAIATAASRRAQGCF